MAQGAPKKNQYWRLRKDMSEDGHKISLEDLEIKLQEYIDRCVNEKLQEQQLIKRKISRDEEVIEKETCDKMIAMSIWGACVCIGITHTTWQEWRKDKKYSSVLLRAENIFKAWNVEGSSAGFLNQSIIARIEGLKDSSEVDLKNPDGSLQSRIIVNYNDKEINLKTE